MNPILVLTMTLVVSKVISMNFFVFFIIITISIFYFTQDDLFEQEREELDRLWAKIQQITGCTTHEEMEQQEQQEMSRWKLKNDATSDGLPYTIMDLKNYAQGKTMQDRKYRFLKFANADEYPGSDGNATLRWYRHNRADRLVFSDTMDRYLFERRLMNERNVAIYFDGVPGNPKFYRAVESVLINISIVLQLPIKNVMFGEQISQFVTGCDSSKFPAVFVALMLQAIENPRPIEITSDQQIQEAKLTLQKAELICVINPFTQFIYGLMQQLEEGVVNIGQAGVHGFSETQFHFHIGILIDANIITNTNGVLGTFSTCLDLYHSRKSKKSLPFI